MKRRLTLLALTAVSVSLVGNIAALAPAAGASSSGSNGKATSRVILATSASRAILVTSASGLSAALAGGRTLTHRQVQSLGGATSTTGFVPMANTPNGFTLLNPGNKTSDYVYRSTMMSIAPMLCSKTNCRIETIVNVNLTERLIGNTSHVWELRLNYTPKINAAGLTWTYHTDYWCGVDINNSRDHLCDTRTGAAPSGIAMSHNTTVKHPWGSTNGIKTFPMVQANIVFSNGQSGTLKFRGWDALNKARGTMLAAKPTN